MGKSQRVSMYLLTFFSRAVGCSLRIAFSFVKPYMRDRLQMSESSLGFFDMMLVISTTVGILMKDFLIDKDEKPTINYIKGTVLLTMTVSTIPAFCLLQESWSWNFARQTIFYILSICYFSAGIFHFASWPMSQKLLCCYFTQQRDGTLLALWATSWEVGNILALAACNLVVYQLGSRWQVAIFSLQIVVMSLVLVAAKVHGNKQENHDYLISQATQAEPFCVFLKRSIFDLDTVFLLLKSGFSSGSFFAFLFWLPIYFQSIGFGHISGYITVLFESFAIVGALAYGRIFQEKVLIRSENVSTVKHLIIDHLNEISIGVSCMLIYALVYIRNDFWSYLVLISSVGVIFGGMYNNLHSTEMLSILSKQPESVQNMCSIVAGSDTIFVAVSQLLIGLVLDSANKDHFQENPMSSFQQSRLTSYDYSAIFYCTFGLNLIALLVFAVQRFLGSNNSVRLQKDNQTIEPQIANISQTSAQ